MSYIIIDHQTQPFGNFLSDIHISNGSKQSGKFFGLSELPEQLLGSE